MKDGCEEEIPLNFSRRQVAGRPKKATAPAETRIPRIARLMALAIKFQGMVDGGEVRDYAEIARLGYVIFQVCHPIYRRWLREAMLAMVFGIELLNAYDKDPEPFEAAQWVTPGWPWVDPEKDMKAAERAIRDGLSTRSIECAAQGYDAS